MSKQKRDFLIYSFSGLIMLILISYSGIKNMNRKVDDIAVDIALNEGNYFTDKLEVMSLMTLNESDYIIGSEVDEISPKSLEERVEENPFVEEAQVYRDLKGNVKVDVIQSKPIARIVKGGKNDKYVDVKGNILPINAKHTARVTLVEIEGGLEWERKLTETRYGEQVFDLLSFIDSDVFWKAQIAHIVIRKDGEIVLLPQVTKQHISFGYPEEIEEKFKKLMIFYKEILPAKGWNEYSMVNLKYENQIICE